MKRQELAKLPTGSIVKVGRGRRYDELNLHAAEVTGPVQQISTSRLSPAYLWTIEVQLLDPQPPQSWGLPHDRYRFDRELRYWRTSVGSSLVEPFRIESRYVRDVEAGSWRARVRAAEAKAKRDAETARLVADERSRQASFLEVKDTLPKGTNVHIGNTSGGQAIVVEPTDLDEARAVVEEWSEARLTVLVHLNDDGTINRDGWMR